MAVTYVGGVSTGRAGATSTALQSLSGTLTGGSATSPASGDLIVVTVVTGTTSDRRPSTTPTLPVTAQTNLTQLVANGTTYDTLMTVSYGFYSSGTDVTLPSTGDIADAQHWTVQVFRGVDSGTPMDVAAVSATATGTSRADPPAITPVTLDAWVVICTGGAAAVGAAFTYTGVTNQIGGATADTVDAVVGSAYVPSWTSGAVNIAASSTGSADPADSWAAYTLALRPNAAASTLTENFSAALDTTNKWTATVDTTSSYDVTNGTLNQTCTGTDQFATLKSKAKFSLTGSSIYVKLAQGATNGGANGADAEFFLEATDGTKLAVWQNSNNIITFGYNNTSLSQITYVPATHTWLRFREASGTLYWDHAPATATNPPSSGDWVNQASLALTTFTAGVDDLFVSLNSTTWTASTNGTVKWDGLNTAAGASFSDSVTETATVTESPSASFSVGGGVNETATVTESASTIFSGGGTVAETATVTHTELSGLVFAETMTETATVTESPSASFSVGTAVTETATVTHTQPGGMAFASATSDTATVTETVDRTITIPTGAVAETATPTEVQTSVFSGESALAETATVTHTENATRLKVVTETAAPTDVLNGVPLYARSVAETSTVTETLSGTSGPTSLLAETATVTHTQDGTLPTVADLIENFNSAALNTTKWNTTGTVSPGTVAQTDGQLVLALNQATSGSQAWIGTTSRYSLTGSAVYVKCVAGPSSTGVFGAQASIRVEVSGTSYVTMEADSAGPLLYFSTVNAGTSTYTDSVTYVPATHAWWRIRESAGTIFFDTAPSTASNPPLSGDWVNQKSVLVSTSGLSGLGSTVVRLGALLLGTQSATPSPMVFDGVNSASGLSYHSANTETATLTHTQSVTGAFNLSVVEKGKLEETTRGGVVLTGAFADAPALSDALLAGWGYFAAYTETTTPTENTGGGLLTLVDLGESSILGEDLFAGRKQWESTSTPATTWAPVVNATTPWSDLDVRSSNPGWTTGTQ